MVRVFSVSITSVISVLLLATMAEAATIDDASLSFSSTQTTFLASCNENECLSGTFIPELYAGDGVTVLGTGTPIILDTLDLPVLYTITYTDGTLANGTPYFLSLSETAGVLGGTSGDYLALTFGASTSSETCEGVTVFDSSFRVNADTSAGVDDFLPGLSCTPLDPLTGVGRDLVYGMQLDATTGVRLLVDPEDGYDVAIYVVTDCQDIDNTCVATKDAGLASTNEELYFDALADQPYFIIVDGKNGNSGSFVLRAKIDATAPTEGEGTADGEGTVDGEGAVDGEGTVDGEGSVDGEGVVDGEGIADGEGVVDGEGGAELCEITLSPVADVTIYNNALDPGEAANGAGQRLFVGTTNSNATRRALLDFDVTASLPADATIVSVELRMAMDRASSNDSVALSLSRLTNGFNQGLTDPQDSGDGNGEGNGAQAATGDTTWLHTNYDTNFWIAAGGDFAASDSATTLVGGNGDYTWAGDNLVADVQAWLDGTFTEFGWILVGGESSGGTVKRFLSEESATLETRPRLTITYTSDEPCAPPEGEGEGIADGEGAADGEGTVDGEGAADGEGVVDGEGTVDGEGVVDGEGTEDGEGELPVVIGFVTPDAVTFSRPTDILLGGTFSDEVLQNTGALSIRFTAVQGQIDTENDSVGTITALSDTTLSAVTPQRNEPGESDVYLVANLESGLVVSNALPFTFLDQSDADRYEQLLFSFASTDSNADGKVTLEEILFQFPGFPQETFDASDVNDDGFLSVSELLALTPTDVVHSGDTNGDYVLGLSELIRIIQLYNAETYACADNAAATEDGFEPRPPANGDPTCIFHSIDQDEDNNISLSELLRGIQLYNLLGYQYCVESATEDDFCSSK